MSIDTTSAAEAVEALIEQYSKLVFRVIYGLTGDWQESQDLTQDTFISAFKAIDAARQTSGANFHAKAWLLRIAANHARMSYRRRSAIGFVPFSALRQEEQAETNAECIEERAAPVQPAGYGMGAAARDPAEIVAERDAVRRTMAQLPGTLSLCLLLSVVGELSSQEIGSQLGLSEAAVRQRLSRARKLFQRFYRQESGEIIADGLIPTPQSKRQGRPRVLVKRPAYAAASMPA
jgi:RNA polymerase sigma-70 factor (ECF subfamily)